VSRLPAPSAQTIQKIQKCKKYKNAKKKYKSANGVKRDFFLKNLHSKKAKPHAKTKPKIPRNRNCGLLLRPFEVFRESLTTMEGTPSAGTDANEAPRATPALASQADAPAAAISTATRPTASTAPATTAAAADDALQGSRGAYASALADASVVVSVVAPPSQPVGTINTIHVSYKKAVCMISIAKCKAGILADDWNLDMKALVTAGFKRDALVKKIIEGPPGLKGKWIMREILPVFGPDRFSKNEHATRAINDTTIEQYRSRDYFHMTHNNVSLANLYAIIVLILILYHVH
jgi:hypothetical protein